MRWWLAKILLVWLRLIRIELSGDPKYVKSSTEKHVLICSGLDPSGGAGFIADCRVVSACGARPVGVITAHTVQNTTGVAAVSTVSAKMIAAQLAALLTDIKIDAIKIGMLGNVQIARALLNALADANCEAPMVWDPVFRPTRGGVALYEGDIVELLTLFASHRDRTGSPHMLITPNTVELAEMIGVDISDEESVRNCAHAFVKQYSLDILVKGGHLHDSADSEVVDWLFESTAIAPETKLGLSRIATLDAGGVHGTGCALSSAIAAHLACGESLPHACALAKQWVHSRISSAIAAGHGAKSIV
jgi:hydroxymethylpyrimidine/phosphomethylpyrimidine kinase